MNLYNYYNKPEELDGFNKKYIVTNNSGKESYHNGLKHNEDGPAVEYIDGNKEWYLNGQLQS